jgi:hypothetical protein
LGLRDGDSLEKNSISSVELPVKSFEQQIDDAEKFIQKAD